MRTISLEGIERVYPGPPPVHALREVDLTVPKGEYAAITGPSGSGKSTLLNIIGLLDRPDSGVYRLDGVDVGTLSEADRTAVRASRIGFVFQAFHLLPYRSALENVALAQMYNGTKRNERARAAARALERVGLAHRIDALPTTMSGGERQRVAIARALVNRPSLLLCDEPTGNLDSVTAGGIAGLLADLHQDGQTVIVITHDLRLASQAQRTVSIKDGRISTAAAQASE